MGTASIAGRRFVSADGRLILEIPPGALRGPIDVSITVASPPPGGSLGAAYEIEPVDEPLLIPARVFFRYTAAELAGGRPSDLRIGLRQENSWISLPEVAADASITMVEAAHQPARRRGPLARSVPGLRQHLRPGRLQGRAPIPTSRRPSPANVSTTAWDARSASQPVTTMAMASVKAIRPGASRAAIAPTTIRPVSRARARPAAT